MFPLANLAAEAGDAFHYHRASLSQHRLRHRHRSNRAIELDLANNVATRVVNEGFVSVPNAVQAIQLAANNLIFDPTRRVLWASLPATVAPPLGKSVVSIDPVTGIVSDPIPLLASPTMACMALSANGRYLRGIERPSRDVALGFVDVTRRNHDAGTRQQSMGRQWNRRWMSACSTVTGRASLW